MSANATAAPSVAAGQLIELDGTENTRTLAGFHTSDGSVGREQRVLRSDDLSELTPDDITALQAQKVVTVVDLRTSIERTVQPDKTIVGADAKWFDVLGALPPTSLIDLPGAYRTFVTDTGARAAFGATLQAIKAAAADGNAVLYHCSAGKDRTGWISAVLLTLVGVDRATVESDFLASNTYRHAATNDPINGATIDWLRSAFAAADQVYGGFDEYVRTGLGLTDADVSELKTGLLTQ